MVKFYVFLFTKGEAPSGDNLKMKLSHKFSIASLIGLTSCFFACSNVDPGVHSAEPAKEIQVKNQASIADSTLHINLIKYRAIGFKGDTTEWNEADCHINDTSFSCYNLKYVSNCSVKDMVIKKCHDDNGNKIECLGYKDTIYDTTYKNINFGENALVNYIPVAKIPEFNRDTVQKLLSTLYGDYCAQFFSFTSEYDLEPVGLPEGFSLKNKRSVPFGFDATYHSGECDVHAANVQYMPSNDPIYIDRRLPEMVETNTYQFFNGSTKTYRDTTIVWKLVYKDLYGRGDTLDITTKFIADSTRDTSAIMVGGYKHGGSYTTVKPIKF